MRLMLDTHVLLWWLQDNPRLGQQARTIIADPDNHVLVSIATPWEISIKHRIGKMAQSGAVIMGLLVDQGFVLVNVNARHLAVLEAMPLLHRDPFDHLIIAQALGEQAAIMTDDRQFAGYGVQCVPA